MSACHPGHGEGIADAPRGVAAGELARIDTSVRNIWRGLRDVHELAPSGEDARRLDGAAAIVNPAPETLIIDPGCMTTELPAERFTVPPLMVNSPTVCWMLLA